MAKDTKRLQKTEVLSMRLDPRVRFIIDLLARIRGQSISTVVERALLEVADKTEIGRDENGYAKRWRDYWDLSEGIRTLKIASDNDTFPSFEDEEKAAFAKAHSIFFYKDNNCTQYKDWAIDIIWPRIEEFMEIWDNTKATDYFAAGKAMREAISKAGVKAPDWPPQSPPSKQPASKPSGGRSSSIADELDDDIPF